MKTVDLSKMTLEDLANLVDDQYFLAALFEAGVEEWEGFDKANEIYEFMVEQSEEGDANEARNGA